MENAELQQNLQGIDVSIIIVNFNTTELTLNCIDSIIEHTKSIIYEIIVIDNSLHQDIRLKKIDIENYLYIYAGDNLGFGRANNLGVSYASGKCIFLLNSDTILLNDAIGQMYSYLTIDGKESQVGIVGSFLLTDKYEIGIFSAKFPSIKNTFIQLYRGLLKRMIKEKSKRLDTTHDIEVEVISGANLFMSRSLFNEVGGFDNDYFLYGEEVELEKRIADLGYRRIIITGPKIIHFEGKSDNKINKLSTSSIYRMNVGKILYAQKHFTLIYGWVYVLINYLSMLCFTLIDARYDIKERKKILSLYQSFLFQKNNDTLPFKY